MRTHSFFLALGLMLVVGLDLDAQYEDIDKTTLKKPEDGKDVPSVKPPQDAMVLFDGKNLDQWVSTKKGVKADWTLTDSAMQVKGGSIRTEKTFPGPYKLHVEFRVPIRGGSNSGVYVQGRYELQVINGYGKGLSKNGCGSVYGQAAPLVNVCKAPGVWQSFDIEYQPPKCENDKVVEPGLLTVYHNGVKIHDQVKLDKATGGSLDRNVCAPGPLMLQDHGAPVQYRNIWIVPGK